MFQNVNHSPIKTHSCPEYRRAIRLYIRHKLTNLLTYAFHTHQSCQLLESCQLICFQHQISMPDQVRYQISNFTSTCGKNPFFH